MKPTKTFVSSKIHGIRVTDKSVRYHGSVTICPELLKLARVSPFEQVHVVNLSNGQRWVTYALAGRPQEFSLNGGGARLGEVGDECVVIAYASAKRFSGAEVVFCDEGNLPTETMQYLDPA